MNKNLIRSADSPSLWNCALAPGWTKEELEILRLAIMKFGLGSWTKIMRSHCLPKKTFGQLNLQTQRMMGQQSLGGFFFLFFFFESKSLHKFSSRIYGYSS